jgi:hypothetical protein
MLMAHDLASLRQHHTGRRGEPFQNLRGEVRDRALILLAVYMARAHVRCGPVLPRWLKAALCAAASRVAQHGPPPNYNQRLAYRRWKRCRARKRMIEEYGDPAAPNPTGSTSPVSPQHPKAHCCDPSERTVDD